MILFIGDEDRGFFVRETAAVRGDQVSYIKSGTSIYSQRSELLKQEADYLVFDIEQYLDAAPDLAAEIDRITRAKSWETVIYAPGYDRQSRIVQELQFHGIRYFIYSGNNAEAREELECALSGYYVEPEKESMEQIRKREETVSGGKKIGIAGACRRMGTTTLAIQLVKYLQLNGYKACYLEVNDTGFVQQHEQTFNVVHDSYLGKVTFADVEMYYRQENLPAVLKQDYDYYVYDFGTYMDTDFNKTSFLEKDARIFVMGSKASEMPYSKEILRNEYYRDVSYVFNFISEKEKSELLEFMEEKAGQTYFMPYAPDQFEYVPGEYEKLLPVEDISVKEEPTRRRGLFGFMGKKEKHGKAETGREV